jgi:hypothetical protein
MWHAWARRRIHVGLWWGNLKERDYFVDLAFNGRIILKWNGMTGHRLNLSLSQEGQVKGAFECSHESAASINVGELLE